ncbi:hypothetical protein B0T24DRAFT_608288 [Lasiosphaeria ovina]|uniref:IBR domain-containing protein n=1 Tax=Lasiosphaeria ovina TaxID=92902 RepID=A0AAE0NMV1_9PEZI|nr:hypothetical protein B0T24DRAFT_608288 [Lasiosphaeria ovina]
MTCRSCGFEFCWECLADWNYIHTMDPLTGDARYERRGHNPGCYFREDSAPQATRVAGNTVIEAIGML